MSCISRSAVVAQGIALVIFLTPPWKLLACSSKRWAATENSLVSWAVETGNRHRWWLVYRMLVFERQSHRDAWTTPFSWFYALGHAAGWWLSRSRGPSDPSPLCLGSLRSMISLWRILVKNRLRWCRSFIRLKIFFASPRDVVVTDTGEALFWWSFVEGRDKQAGDRFQLSSARLEIPRKENTIILMENDREGVRLSLHGFSEVLNGSCLLVRFAPFYFHRKSL